MTLFFIMASYSLNEFYLALAWAMIMSGKYPRFVMHIWIIFLEGFDTRI